MALIGFPNLQQPMVTPQNGIVTQPWYRLLVDLFAAVTSGTGEVVIFAGPTVPKGSVACNGAAISRTIYRALFAVIGTIYGVGDGVSTFNVPNLAAPFASMMYVIRT